MKLGTELSRGECMRACMDQSLSFICYHQNPFACGLTEFRSSNHLLGRCFRLQTCLVERYCQTYFFSLESPASRGIAMGHLGPNRENTRPRIPRVCTHAASPMILLHSRKLFASCTMTRTAIPVAHLLRQTEQTVLPVAALRHLTERLMPPVSSLSAESG